MQDKYETRLRARVYHTLELLVEEGLVCSNDLGGDRVYYTPLRHGPHIHLVCRHCGQVIEPAVSIPIFTNEELITVDAFNKTMVEVVLDSALDAVSTAAEYQQKVLSIAEFVGASDANRAAIDAIIKGKALPYLLSLVTGEVRGDSRGGWASTREWLAFGDDVEFRCSVNYAGIWWNSSAEVVYYMGFNDEGGDAPKSEVLSDEWYGPPIEKVN
jgi:hypothetical protein